ncbi:SURF1 family protein [Georgenia thermotolerans]|uniref:SURF1-like protein n=1 Tax=Georgenia thermotolerans TaxID=527326 RepID=A0A7J5ULE2_9MICO|nr:SURF1 family protein [Georgenia thermotolerans]KAE8763199.1 SURF1 family protein [Georgenia thermotolerans]
MDPRPVAGRPGPAAPDGAGAGEAPARDGDREAHVPGVAARAPRGGRGARMTGQRSDYLRAALTPRLIGIFVLLLAAAVVCVRLGAWQLDRAAIRGAAKAEAAHAATLAADPVPLADVLQPQTTFTAKELARTVEVTGTYRADQQVLVPGREVDGHPATLVVTALWVSEGPDAGAMLPVVRGWVPAEAIRTDGRAEPADAATAALLRVPDGVQRVTGHLGASEVAESGAYPEGMVGAISSAQLANLWGGPTFSGYLVEFTENPDGTRSAVAPTGLSHAPPPAMAQETGLNIQNLAYAVEWVIFGGFALVLWWRMVRDEVIYRREEAALA